MWHTKNAFFREMQFWSHCYTVVSYQALFRLPVCKIPAVYLSGAKNVGFCTIRDFGSPTNSIFIPMSVLFVFLCNGAIQWTYTFTNRRTSTLFLLVSRKNCLKRLNLKEKTEKKGDANLPSMMQRMKPQ